MCISISICLTLLTIIAAMHLILKAHNAGMSAVFKWISYFIVLAGLALLICLGCCGIRKMCRHHGDNDCKEECHSWMKCHKGMTGSMHGCMMYGHSGMRCCDMKEGDDACCDKMMKGDSAYSQMECKEMMVKEKE